MALVDLATLEAVFLVAMGGWLLVLGGAFLLSRRVVDRASAVLLALAGFYALLWQQPALLGVGEAFHVALAQPVFMLLLSGAIFLWTYWLFERHVEQLERSHEDLEEALTVEQTLVDVLSHDLRNPLTSAKLSLQRIRREFPERADQLDSVVDDLRTATDVMDNGLVYSRVSTPGTGPDRSDVVAVDLTDLVENAADRCRRKAKAQDVHLETEGPSKLEVQANPLLESAVQNLVDNAVKFSPAGGEVRVSVRDEGDEAVLTVADEGPGIPEDDHDKIFDRFEQGEGESSGDGLGLAIIDRLVDLHDGKIEVHDTPGGGTTVEVRLPRGRPRTNHKGSASIASKAAVRAGGEGQ